MAGKGGVTVFNFRKRLFYPIHVERVDPVFAQQLVEHYGSKDGELASAVQYLSHRNNMHNRTVQELMGLLAAEELSHLEMLAVVINKLGERPVGLANRAGIPWSVSFVDQSTNPVALLQADIDMELRSNAIYGEYSKITQDMGLQRLFSFLAMREGIHKRLLQKTQILFQQGGTSEQFSELIYEYKMSLQVLD